MTQDTSADPQQERAAIWQARLSDLGLSGLVTALGQATRPLWPVLAQVMWVAQPTLGLMSGTLGKDADLLAGLLDDPAALDDFLSQLADFEQSE